MSLQNRRAFVAVIVVCIAAGVFFRLFHVDWKLYSFDETVTSLRATGHTLDDYEAFIGDGRSHAIGDLRPFQAPARDMNEGAVWDSLALEDPQHPPLYFWVTSLSERLTGDSVFLRRLPAVLFGLLCVPAMWWFARELFDDAATAWCVAALVAVSPFHLAFAQQAREYSFWTLMTAVSSALLLRALRGNGVWTWIAFALSITAGLWGFALFGQVILAQAIYVVAFSAAPVRLRLYAIAAMAAGAATFVPWLVVIARGARTAISDTTYSATHLSALLYAGKWIFNAGTTVFDLDYITVAFVPVTLALLAVMAWCCYTLGRTAPRRVWAFVAALGAVAAISCLGPDLVLHESRAAENRYLTVLWISLELATGYALARGVALGGRRATAWRWAAGAVVVAGIASCGVSAFAHTWWVASNEKSLPGIEAALQREPAATLVYVNDPYMLLELLPGARDDLRFALHREISEAALRSAPRPFVIAKPSDAERSPVAARLRVVPLVAPFPPLEDRAIEMLHRRAAGERTGSGYQLEALYSGVR